MSIKNKTVIRPNLPDDVENLKLPKWDRDGNLVNKTKPKPKQRAVTESIADVDVEQVKAPTLKELEAIQESAYNEGFEQGYQNGLAQGTREGKTEGLQTGKAEGRELGLEEGKKAGQAQALAEEQKKTDEKLQVLESISEELKKQIPQEQKELEQALLALAIRLARQVLQDEIKANPKHIESIVHAAVQSLPNPDDKLTVSVNSNDFDLVTQFADSHWKIVSDDKITQGGCEVKSGYSYIDYTLEHRFGSAISHFISHLGEGANVETIKSPLAAEDLLTGVSNAEEKLNAAQSDTLAETNIADPTAEQTVAEETVGDENRVEGNSADDNRVDEPNIENAQTDDPFLEAVKTEPDALLSETTLSEQGDESASELQPDASDSGVENKQTENSPIDSNEQVSWSEESSENDDDKTTTD